MTYLNDVSSDALREQLDYVEGKKPAQRLIVGINYKNGVSPTEIAEWYGLTRKTVYNWLERLEDEPLERAIHDRDRPGRPPKLSGEQRQSVREILSNPPSDAGFGSRREWTPELLRQYLEERFDVEYTHRHARTLLADLGTDRK